MQHSIKKPGEVIGRIKELNSRDDVYKSGVYFLYHEEQPSDVYVGSTGLLKPQKGEGGFCKRFSTHLYRLRKGVHHSAKLQQIVNVFGLNGVRMDILEICDSHLVISREQFYLDYLNPALNTQPFADSRRGVTASLEVRLKMSQAKKGIRPANYNSLQSAENRAKNAASRLGKKRAIALIEKAYKPVLQYFKGQLITSFRSVKEAADQTGVNRASISLCALGKRKSGGGFQWQFAEARQKDIKLSKFNDKLTNA